MARQTMGEQIVPDTKQVRDLLDYYSRTAKDYDIHEQDEEHRIALDLVVPYLKYLETTSVLDVGCGTGRVMRYLQDKMPEVRLQGIDPSQELLNVASATHGVPTDWLTCGVGEKLPFRDEEFDFVIATAVMHHVAEPELVILEMFRVSKLGVVISDTNTYGQGRIIVRVAKVGARQLHIIGPLQWLRHRGKRWVYSEGDGVSLPYSVFDSLRVVEQACETVVLAPTKGTESMQAFPLLCASHVLVLGIKTAE